MQLSFGFLEVFALLFGLAFWGAVFWIVWRVVTSIRAIERELGEIRRELHRIAERRP